MVEKLKQCLDAWRADVINAALNYKQKEREESKQRFCTFRVISFVGDLIWFICDLVISCFVQKLFHGPQSSSDGLSSCLILTFLTTVSLVHSQTYLFFSGFTVDLHSACNKPFLCSINLLTGQFDIWGKGEKHWSKLKSSVARSVQPSKINVNIYI